MLTQIKHIHHKLTKRGDRWHIRHESKKYIFRNPKETKEGNVIILVSVVCNL